MLEDAVSEWPKRIRPSTLARGRLEVGKDEWQGRPVGGGRTPVSLRALQVVTANCIDSKISRPAKAMLGSSLKSMH